MDSLWLNFGLIDYRGTLTLLPHICPPWVICIYIFLAISLNHSLKWLSNHPYFAGLCGGAGAVLTYVGGEQVGAAQFCAPNYLVPLIVGAVWSLFFPIALHYCSRSEA